MSRFRLWASRSLGFDLRSLALLRIAAPGVYLVELLRHWQYLEAYCTDEGMLPRSVLFESPGSGWSIYLAYGTLAGVRFLFSCHLLAVVCLILGWRCRWASLACYLFTFSLQNRFPALPGWETEIRLLFLIGCFLPWAERYSLDARSRKEPAGPDFVVSPATVAWRLQIAILYLASGLLKSGPGWADGTAVEVSLASDAYSTTLGLQFLAQLQHYPESLVALNYTVPLVEIFSPLLLLSPWPWLQMSGVVVLWLLHAGFGLCLHLGMFSPICCACLLGFVPSSFWNRKPVETATYKRKVGESLFLGWVCLSMGTSFLETLPELKDFVRPLARVPWTTLGVQQNWGMFVPPPFEGGWHVIKGRTLQNEWVDLLHLTREASEERPEIVYKSYPGVRGYLFLAAHLRSTDSGSAYIRECVANYYRQRWENAYPSAQDRLARVEILFFKREYVPGKGFGDSERMPIFARDY